MTDMQLSSPICLMHLLMHLANSVMKQEASKSIIALAGGGFKDMSRIAKSSPKYVGRYLQTK